jgi:hypothetical protein
MSLWRDVKESMSALLAAMAVQCVILVVNLCVFP